MQISRIVSVHAVFHRRAVLTDGGEWQHRMEARGLSGLTFQHGFQVLAAVTPLRG